MTANRLATPTHPSRALRMLLLPLLVAGAGVLSQTAWAAPHGGMGGHGGMGMHEGMGAPRHMQRMLDLVKATPEQRAQIKQLTDAARTASAGQHEAARALHEQGKALFAQPTVDARAAEALRQQMLAQHDQASKRRMQLMLDISQVLTPEQRQSLSETMGKRRAMMERHRAERQSMQPAPR